METILEIKNLTKSYGAKKVLSDVSFDVKKGGAVGLLGPNGAGKTTLMNIITGYLSPSSGSVLVCGRDITEQSIEMRKKIGYLPETPPLYEDMTVREYMNYVFYLKKCGTRRSGKERVSECLHLTGLAGEEGRLIANLSKGYRQRVGLAQAILGNPELLVLDEPTVGLDPVQISEIRELIRKIAETRTVILSTHILQEVTAVCKSVVIINKGEIKVSAALGELERSGESRLSLICDAADAARILAEGGLEFYPLPCDEDGVCAYAVKNTASARERAALCEYLSEKGLQIAELTHMRRGIEDIFEDYIAEEE